MLLSGERCEHGMRVEVHEQFRMAQWQLGKAMPLVDSGQCVEASKGIGGINGRSHSSIARLSMRSMSASSIVRHVF